MTINDVVRKWAIRKAIDIDREIVGIPSRPYFPDGLAMILDQSNPPIEDAEFEIIEPNQLADGKIDD